MEDFQGKAFPVFNKGLPPCPSQFGKSRLVAEITKAQTYKNQLLFWFWSGK